MRHLRPIKIFCQLSELSQLSESYIRKILNMAEIEINSGAPSAMCRSAKRQRDQSDPGLITGLDITAWCDKTSFDDLVGALRSYCSKWVFQKEAGTVNGTEHWQIRARTSDRKHIGVHQRNLGELLPGAKIAPTSSNVHHAKNFNYVMKSETRVEGPWKDTDEDPEEAYIPDQFKIDKFLPWQEHLLQVSMMQYNDFRSINFLYCPQGNIGKSTLAGYLDCKGKAYDVPTIVDAERLVATLCNKFSNAKNRDPGIIFIDIPRKQEQKKMSSIYTAIEQIKKGSLFDTRYKHQEWKIRSPVIWVFTNEEPELTSLSADRWKIWKVVDINSEMVRIR